MTGYSQLVRMADELGKLCLRLKRGEDIYLGEAVEEYRERLEQEALWGFLVELRDTECQIRRAAAQYQCDCHAYTFFIV